LSQWILIEEVELVWVLFDLHSIPSVKVGEVIAGSPEQVVMT
jgi:hypothetical protein